MLKSTVGMYTAPRVNQLSFRSDFDKKKIKFLQQMYASYSTTKPYDSWFTDSRAPVCMQTE